MDNKNNDDKLFSQTYPIVKVDKNVLNKQIKEKKFDLIKSALEQLPNFIDGAKAVLETTKELCTSSDNSQKQYLDTCNLLIESLIKEREKNISQAEKDKYFYQTKEILEKMSQKDTENKNFILDTIKVAGTLLLVGTGLFLGKNYLDEHPL